MLLAGVNDDLETMKTLVHKLLMCRVRPYYLYQCDLINGSSHLRTSVAKGIEIIEGLRGHTTGYAVPQFVIDAPGGGGKVPINPGYILYHDNEKIVIRNYEGKIFEYPETGGDEMCSSLPSANRADGSRATWMEGRQAERAGASKSLSRRIPVFAEREDRIIELIRIELDRRETNPVNRDNPV